MSHISRRRFLEDSMLAAAAAAAMSSTALAADDKQPEEKQSDSPGEKLIAAVIGTGGRGAEHIQRLVGRKDVEIRYLVDVDPAHLREKAKIIKEKQGREPKCVQDLREVLDDKSIDFVTIATPNHWHALAAIWAIQAGKDVYVEKPVSHNVSEGRRIVEAARKHNRICQAGTQSRSSNGLHEAMQYLRDGKLGEVSLARGLCYKRRPSIGPKGEYKVPEGVDYDLWLGPAPMAAVTRPRFHYDWHWQWPYGNGDLGNQGIHQMDISRWALGMNTLPQSVVSYGGRLGYEDAGETANTHIVMHDYGSKSLVFEVRGLETKPYRDASVGVIVEGTEGYMVIPSYSHATVFDKTGKQVREFNGVERHFENFLAVVRSRKVEDLNADINEGHLSSALCHLGNISYRLGGMMPLAEVKQRLGSVKTNDNAIDTFERTCEHLRENMLDLEKVQMHFGEQLAVDPAKESFINNSAADAMLTREYRAPYVVPAAGQV